MKRTFFTEFATGFANTSANTIQARKQQEADMDTMRQKALMELDVQTQLQERKQKLEFKTLQEKQRLAQNAFNERVLGQTNAAMTPASPAPMATNPALNPVASGEIDDNAAPFPASSPIGASDTAAPSTPAPVSRVAQPVELERPKAPYTEEELQNVFMSKYDPEDGGAGAMAAVEEFKRKRITETPEWKAKEAGAKKTAETSAEIAATGMPEQEFEARRQELGLPKIRQTQFRNKPQEKLYETFHENVWAGKDAQENYRNNDQIVQLANRFNLLNKTSPTGGFIINTPGVQSALTMLSAEYQAMDDISKGLTMKNIKNLGSGTAISDTDRQYAEKVGLSLSKLTDANEAQAAIITSFAKVQNEYADYMKKVASVQGDTAQAEKEWKEYINANPVFKSTDVGNVVANTNRVSPEAYFKFKEEYAQTPSGAQYKDPFGNIRTKK